MKKYASILLACVLAGLTLSACNGDADETPVSSAAESFPLPSTLTATSSESPPSAAGSEADTSHTTTEATDTSSVADTSSEAPNYSNYTYYTENSANAPDINNITVTTEKALYSTSLTEITVKIQNRTGWEMLYADEYKVERKSGEDWVEIPMRTDIDSYYATAPLSNNQDGTLTLDLTRLSETLGVGTYRISLPMICNGYAGTFYRGAEFSVK